MRLMFSAVNQHKVLPTTSNAAISAYKGTGEDDSAVYGITGALDRLQRLALAIRSPPSTNEVETVQGFANKQRPDGFRELMSTMIRYLFPEAEKTLQNQIVETIVYRRNWLLWRRRHNKKLRQSRKEPSSQSQKEAPAGVQTPKPRQYLRGHERQVNYSDIISQSDFSSTQPSVRRLEAVRPMFMQSMLGHFQLDDASSQRSSNPPPLAQYPTRPLLSTGDTEVECPYCSNKVDMPPGESDEAKDALWRCDIF
jgi:hypothetical protein